MSLAHSRCTTEVRQQGGTRQPRPASAPQLNYDVEPVGSRASSQPQRPCGVAAGPSPPAQLQARSVAPEHPRAGRALPDPGGAGEAA